MEKTASIIGKRCAKSEDIEALVQVIAKKFSPEKIILFGSYATGEPTPESDVDLLVIVNSDRSTWALNVEIGLAVDHAFPLDILVRHKDDVKRRLAKGDFFLEDIFNKGKVMYERTG